MSLISLTIHQLTILDTIFTKRLTRSWESFSLEYMSQVPTTGCASDLNSCHSHRSVLMSSHSPWYRLSPGSYQQFSNQRIRTKYSPSKKAGHPQPELNLVVLLYKGVSHAAQEYTPSALWWSYSPVPGASVPF